MTQFRKRSTMLALCLMAISLGGCGQEAVTFNNTLTKMEDKVEPPVTALLNHFVNYAKTKKFDAVKAEADHAAALAAIDANVKEIQAMQIPSVKMAKEFHTGYLAYYAAIRKVVTEEFRACLDTLKDPSVEEKDKIGQCQITLSAMATLAKEATAALHSVQQQFANANNMKMKE